MDATQELEAWSRVCVFQDYGASASRKLSGGLEYLRELLDNSLAPGPVRNAPPGGGPLRIQVSLNDNLLTYTENGASVSVDASDNLVNYGHKTKGAAAPCLSVYGEIGQGLPMTINALAARSYLFFNHNDVTFVITYGQAVHDVHGAISRGFLIIPKTDPKQTQVQDFLYVVSAKERTYRSQVHESIGLFVRDHWREPHHRSPPPLYANITELMQRAREVPTPGLLFDFVLKEGSSLKVSPNPRTGMLDIEDTECGNFLSEAVRIWYLPGQKQGCDLGAHVQPPPPEEDVVISVQGQLVDRFSEEPWVKQQRIPGTIKTQVVVMAHPQLGEIRAQLLLWPRAAPSAAATGDDDAVDDQIVGGIRLFQSSDRAVWTQRGRVPECLNEARCSLSWHVARTGGRYADDYRHFLSMCGLKDEAAAVDVGLPTKEEFADIQGTRRGSLENRFGEKVVKWWLTLNNMMCYVLLDRTRLHELGLLKETKDDLVNNKLSRELYHIIYRGIAKRIWQERDRIRGAAAAALPVTPLQRLQDRQQPKQQSPQQEEQQRLQQQKQLQQQQQQQKQQKQQKQKQQQEQEQQVQKKQQKQPTEERQQKQQKQTQLQPAERQQPKQKQQQEEPMSKRLPPPLPPLQQQQQQQQSRQQQPALGWSPPLVPPGPASPIPVGRLTRAAASHTVGVGMTSSASGAAHASEKSAPVDAAGHAAAPTLEALLLGSTPVFDVGSRKRKQPERFTFVTPACAAPNKTPTTRLKSTKRASACDESGSQDAELVAELVGSVTETAVRLKKVVLVALGKSGQASLGKQRECAAELVRLSQKVHKVLDRMR